MGLRGFYGVLLPPYDGFIETPVDIVLGASHSLVIVGKIAMTFILNP
jgi:hypothetical protein